WRLGLERYRKPHRQRRLRIAAASPVLAEPAAGPIVEPGFKAGASRTLLVDGVREVAYWTRRRHIGRRGREVVLIAGIPLVDQAVKGRVARTRLSVDHGERAVRTQIACQQGVFEVHRTGAGRDATVAAEQRTDRAAGNHRCPLRLACDLDHALSRERARIPDLAIAGQPRECAIENATGQR